MEYKPVVGDKVDNQLSDIINNNQIVQGKAKMLFVRESEGHYSYCKKKVFMKISQDKLILRVGGGYLSLDQFLDTFNPFQRWREKN